LEITRFVESLETTINIAEQLLTTFDIEAVLRLVVKSLQDLLKAEGATLYLLDPVEKLLISQVILSDRIEEIILPVDNTSIAGYTAINKTSLKIPDVYEDLSYIHKDLKFNRAIDEKYAYKTRSIMTHPLVLKGEVLGVFQIVNKKEGDFTDTDERILKNFAVLAAIAIFNARLMQKIMEEQKKTEDVVEHISDEVIITDREGKIVSLNQQAMESLPKKMSQHEAIGKLYSDVFPRLANLKAEVKKVLEHNLDKAFSGGKMPFVILTVKNARELVEKIILIIKKTLPGVKNDDVALPPESATD